MSRSFARPHGPRPTPWQGCPMMRALFRSSVVLALSSFLAACGGSSPGKPDCHRRPHRHRVQRDRKLAPDRARCRLARLDPARPHRHLAAGRARRAHAHLAIVQIAVYDAVQSISGAYQPYTQMPINRNASMASAIAVAAHDTLSVLFPSQKKSFDLALASDLASDHHTTQQAGIARGSEHPRPAHERRIADPRADLHKHGPSDSNTQIHQIHLHQIHLTRF